jgi:hypothetical protein
LVRLLVYNPDEEFVEYAEGVTDVPREGDEYLTAQGERGRVVGVPTWNFARNEVAVTLVPL